MNANDIKDLGKLEGRLKGIDSKLNDMNKMLVGNGQAGLLERQTRVEENLADVSDNLKDFAELCHATGKKVSDAEKHADDKSLHTAKGLLLRKEVMLVAAMAILGFNSIIPADFSLWDLVSGWLGY